MDSPNGQPLGTSVERSSSGSTRQRLLQAAAELIAELGWGRVTTRAVAERAGLPHGTVSYHFRGKQELLAEAALRTVEHLAPMRELEAVETLAELLQLVSAWASNRDALDPVVSGVLMESMRESERDPTLRHRMVELLADYRRLLTDLVRAEQDRGAVASGAAPSALASLIAAVGDGLLLHALLDPEVDVVAAFEAFGTLLAGQEHG
jgi:AcrR family transcriptional regulator